MRGSGGVPRLRARLDTAEAIEYGAAPDDSFEFGLAVILDGLEAQLAARQATGRAATDRARG